VDVSADGGHTWTPADLVQHPSNRPGRSWAWALWQVGGCIVYVWVWVWVWGGGGMDM
jgi:hypothetical protein